jgi:uncharacterized coiled-coil protein SlyX
VKFASVILAVICFVLLIGLNASVDKIHRLENKLAEKENEIAALQDELNKTIKELENARAKIDELNKELEYYTETREIKLWYFKDLPERYYSKYRFCKEYAKILSNYIMPDNIVVKKFARNITLLRIDNNTYRLDFADGGPVMFYYVYDRDQFGKDEYPINPDYYLMHGFRGDCEDAAVAVVSILKAKGYDAKLILGDLEGIKPLERFARVVHAWVEVKIDGEWYIGDLYFVAKLDVDGEKFMLYEYYFVKKDLARGYHKIAETS